MTPLTLVAAGSELAAHELAVALERTQYGAHVDPVAGPDLARGERAVAGGVAPRDPHERVRDVLEKRRRQPPGRRDSQRVAVQPGIGGVEVALLSGKTNLDRAALGAQVLEHGGGVEADQYTRASFVGGEVAH